MMQRLDQSELCIDGLSAEDQDRLVAILDEYMIALEEGRSPDIESYVAENPDLETALRTYLSGVDLIREVAGEKGPIDSPSPQVSLSEDFDVGQELGRGAMGIVYQATDKKSGQQVAIKVLAFGATLDEQMVVRFRREAESARSLNHPNIVPVTEIGCERGVNYYVMKLIEGASLDQLISKARVERRRGSDNDSLLSGDARYERLAQQYGDVAEALHAAHQAGVIHRDIKPSNLLRDAEGKLWVTDFGLARVIQDQNLTKTGDLIGTYRYMSPEQARGRTDLIGPHTDVYGLGATLYELLTLRPVFRGQDTLKLLHRIDQTTPQPPSHWDPKIPRDLETIVLRAIEPEHTARYPSAGEFAADLKRFAEGKRIRARRKWPAAKFKRWVNAKGIAAIGAAVLFVATASLFALSSGRLENLFSAPRASAAEDQTVVCQLAKMRLQQALQLSPASAELNKHYQETLDLLSTGDIGLAKRRWICRTLNQWSLVLIDQGAWQQAEDQLAKARAAGEHLSDAPRDRGIDQLTRVNSATVRLQSATSIPEELLDQLNENVDVVWLRDSAIDDRDLLAAQMISAYNHLGKSLHERDQNSTALSMLLQVAAKLDSLPAESPVVIKQNANLHSNLGAFFHQEHAYSDSLQQYEKANKLFDTLLLQLPNQSDLIMGKAIALNNLGRALTSAGQLNQAEESFQDALDLASRLVAKDGQNHRLLAQTAGIWNNSGILFRETQKFSQSREAFEQARALQSEALRLQPTNRVYKMELQKIETRLQDVSPLNQGSRTITNVVGEGDLS